MRVFLVALALFSFGLTIPAEARSHRSDGYTDSDGVYHQGYTDSNGVWHNRDRVRAHKRRRNVLLGVGAVGLVTGSPALKVIGLGGAVANEVVDHRHRDW